MYFDKLSILTDFIPKEEKKKPVQILSGPAKNQH